MSTNPAVDMASPAADQLEKLPLTAAPSADAGSLHATQDKTRERVELERDLTTQRANLLQTQATLRESENSRAAYLAEVRRTL